VPPCLLTAAASWELGTLAQALTELEYPALSVFAPTLATSAAGVWPQDVLAVAVAYVIAEPQFRHAPPHMIR
jgi:hypothetical protein